MVGLAAGSIDSNGDFVGADPETIEKNQFARARRAADSTTPSPPPVQRNSGGEGRMRGGKYSSAARPKLDEEKPIGTELRLRHEIIDALGTSNRNVPKIPRFNVTSRKISVSITFNDNITQRFIRGGIQRNIADVLKSTIDSGFDFSEIYIDGSFPFVDKFGSSTEEIVVRVLYSRATVDRINWSRFLPENIYKIADSIWLHPAIHGN